LALGQIVCPRCYSVGTLEEYESNGKIYLRVRHRKERKTFFCYLGPRDRYTYASKILRQPLNNLAHHSYAEEAVQAIDNLIEQARRPFLDKREEAERTLAEMKYLISRMDELKERLRVEAEILEQRLKQSEE
jgi:hypothetical protein